MKRLLLLIAIYSVSFSACDDGFEELNENPLAPTIVNYEALFNELVSSLRLGWNRQLFLHNEILYDVTELGVVTAQTFGNINAGVEDIWSNYYKALKNAYQLEGLVDELSKQDAQAADIVNAQVKILMAYKTFQLLDLFGDIPYSEAGQVYAETEIIRPVYDDDRDIYLSLIEDLRQASAILISAGGNTDLGNPYLRFGEYDALFNDNLDRWTKFSNSMLLKYLVRIHHKEPELANEVVGFMLSNGYNFINPGEDVVMSPADQAWSNEGVNWSFREHNKLRMGTTMWDFLTENGTIIDPRAAIFFETNHAGEWTAFPQVSTANTPQSGGAPYDKDTRDNVYDNKGVDNIYSAFNFYLVRDEQDIPEILLTAAEVKFLLAEVFLSGIGTVKDEFNAAFRYQEGMLVSLEFWQGLVQNSAIWDNKPNLLNTGELFAVSEHPRYKLQIGAPEAENLAKIYSQRWVDYFRQPWEAFTLLRLSNNLPREKDENDFYRFKYPFSESTYNYENWLDQTSKMGGDETNIKLWWME